MLDFPGSLHSPVVFSHKQGVKNNQIQLFVDPEVASKEAILKFTEMILLLLSYFFKNHFTGPIGPMVGKYNLIIDDSFFLPFSRCRKRRSRSLFQTVPSRRKAASPADLFGLSPGWNKVDRNIKATINAFRITFSFPPGALKYAASSSVLP